jgi:hypothetical protein
MVSIFKATLEEEEEEEDEEEEAMHTCRSSSFLAMVMTRDISSMVAAASAPVRVVSSCLQRRRRWFRVGPWIEEEERMWLVGWVLEVSVVVACEGGTCGRFRILFVLCIVCMYVCMCGYGQDRIAKTQTIFKSRYTIYFLTM